MIIIRKRRKREKKEKIFKYFKQCNIKEYYNKEKF